MVSEMNKQTAQETIKQCFQTLNEQQLREYHLTHDYWTGKPLTAEQRRPDVEEVTDPSVVKKQRNLQCLNELLHPAPTLGSVMAETLSALLFETQKTEVALLQKPSEDLMMRVKDWYDCFIADGLDAILPKQSTKLTVSNIDFIKQACAHSTVLAQNICMLAAFWVRSPTEWDKQSGESLLAHIFNEYKTPVVLEDCWLLPGDEDNVQWLLAYIMYAQGGSLKQLAKHFSWLVDSSKTWHLLAEVTARLPVQQAVLQTEIIRLGGNQDDISCIFDNAAYDVDLLRPEHQADRAFWYDTITWIFRNAADSPLYEKRQFLTWARHEFTEHRRKQMDFTMTGRSLAKIQKKLQEYRNAEGRRRAEQMRLETLAIECARARQAAREEREAIAAEELANQYDYYNGYYSETRYDSNVSWPTYGVSWATIQDDHYCSFDEITSSKRLIKEGELMQHCVGGYVDSCMEGYSCIVSLTIDDNPAVTIEIDPQERGLIQASGLQNRSLKRYEEQVIDLWMAKIVNAGKTRKKR